MIPIFQTAFRAARLGRRGVTLTELMVAVAVISIGILGFFAAFSAISVSIHNSRVKSLTTNLAQEKIESLKNLSYYDLLVTTAAAADPLGFSYDTGNYPPETVSIGGITFTRYTLVSLAQVQMPANVITAVDYTYTDTGLKQITVNVVWADNGVRKYWSLTNLLENPLVTPLDATISGTITRSGGGNLANALVYAQENPNYSAVSNSSGKYSFSVYHGSYTIRASLAGYLDGISPQTIIATGGQATVNIALNAIATGTISGEAWINPNLVISQVASGSMTYVYSSMFGPWSSGIVEYVELFNPTTSQINISPPSPNNTAPNAYIKINTNNSGNVVNDIMANSRDCENGSGATGGITSLFVSTYIAAGGYYLIANFPRFMVNGAYVTADAYYNNDIGHVTACLPRYKYGGIQLQDSAGNTLDKVGWQGNGGVPSSSFYNGTAIPTDGQCGLNTGLPAGTCTWSWLGNQIVRPSSPTVMGRTMSAGTYGSAYNSQNNSKDFIYPINGNASTLGLNYSPFTTRSPALTVITGVPAAGAYVAASDPYSGSTKAYTAYITSGALQLPYAPYSLVGVSTSDSSGWVVDIASGNYYVEIGTVVVSQNQVTRIPNASTIPPWTASGLYHARLNSTSTGGFVKGNIVDANNAVVSGISVIGGGASKTTGSNGDYFLTVPSGQVEVIANPNNANPLYVQGDNILTVNTGQIATQDFVLSQGGYIYGYLTTGTTPLPNFVVTAENSAGNQVGTGTTDGSGHFTIRNLSTGSYIVQPVVNTNQASSPALVTTALPTSGATVFAATFTITGALGNIAGTVTNNGSAVTTGALIMASTSTLTMPPAAVYASSSTAQTPIYSVSSLADGTYILPVRGGYTYYVYVSVPQVNGTQVTITNKTYSNVVVAPAATTTQNLSLP